MYLTLGFWYSTFDSCYISKPEMANKNSEKAGKPTSKPAHALSSDLVKKELATDTSNGLSASEAQSRLTQHGRNELQGGPGVQPLKILLAQVANAMMLVSTSA